jgi:hypothetical protein
MEGAAGVNRYLGASSLPVLGHGCPTLAVILSDTDPKLVEGEGESKDPRFVLLRLGWDGTLSVAQPDGCEGKKKYSSPSDRYNR